MSVGHRDRVLLDTRIDEEALLATKRDTSSPIVQIAHPRKGIWSGNNQLGVELPFSPDSNRMQTIFKMDEWGFPEVWTVSLAFAFPGPAGAFELPAGQFFDATAQVLYGAGGITQEFECDWVDGTIFSLPMNAINVRARWNDFAAFLGVAVPEGVRLSVQIARGSIRHARATKSIPFNAPNIPGPPFLVAGTRIPAFAKSAIVVPIDTNDAATLYAGTFFLQFMPNADPAAPPIMTVPGNLLGPTTSFKVPIPALAHYVRVVNTALTAATGVVIFNLFDE